MSNKLVPICVMLMCAGLFSSCTHPSPATPPPDSVAISGPKTGFTSVPYTFKGTINFSSDAALIYQWSFDSTTVSKMTDTAALTFKDSGSQIIRLSIIRTGNNALLCTASDTIHIVDTTTHDTVHAPTDFTWTQYTGVNGENKRGSGNEFKRACWIPRN